MNIYEQIVLRWKEQMLARRPAVGPNALDKFEEIHGLKLPVALRRLFLLSNGLAQGEYDRVNHVRFWPLEELSYVKECAPELATSATDEHLVFADYSVWAHAYAVSPKVGSVVVIGGTKARNLSGSMDDFMSMYLENDLSRVESA